MNIELNSGTIPVLKVLGLNPNGVTRKSLIAKWLLRTSSFVPVALSALKRLDERLYTMIVG